MNLRLSNLITGAIAGGIGAAVAIAGVLGLGTLGGSAFGIAVAMSLGAAGAWAVLGRIETIVVARLATLNAIEGSSGKSLASNSPAWPEVDDILGSIAKRIERLNAVKGEYEELESIARSITAGPGYRGYSKHASGPSTARQCVLDLFEDLGRTAAIILETSDTLDDAITQLTRGTGDQDDSISQTTSTVETLSDNIDAISQNAEAAAVASERTRQEALSGLERVHEAIDGMERLRLHVDANGRKIRRLGDRSIEIGTIIDLINGISSRTDMLALNATIESVKAGEHGRGFAVVAEEIRKLAERTANATKDIAVIVEAIQADTNESIRALSEEQSEVDREARRVSEAGAALGRISAVAEESAKLVDGISRSATDQVMATQELVLSTQKFADVIHETVIASNKAHEQVEHLMDHCERFRRIFAGEVPSRSAHASYSRPNGNLQSRLTAIEPAL